MLATVQFRIISITVPNQKPRGLKYKTLQFYLLIRVWNFTSRPKNRTQTADVREQSGEDNIWA